MNYTEFLRELAVDLQDELNQRNRDTEVFDTKIFNKKTLADFTTEEILAEMKRRIKCNRVKIVLNQNDKKRDLEK